MTGPSVHLDKSILIRLLEEYFVIRVSRNASSIVYKNEFDNFYFPLDIDLTEFDEEALVESIRLIILKDVIRQFTKTKGNYFDCINRSEWRRKTAQGKHFCKR